MTKILEQVLLQGKRENLTIN